MQYRIFAIPADGSLELEEEMNQFLRSHRVVSVRKVIESWEGMPRWCFCIEYIEGNISSSRKGLEQSKRIDYREELSEDDFAVFARLRDVRKELASAEAIPVYAVCKNEILADMAKKKPDSMSALKKIEGFGSAKLEKYGKAFLAAITVNTDKEMNNNAKSDKPGEQKKLINS